MVRVIRCEPSTIAELKTVVEDFVLNMSEEEIWKMVHNAKKKSRMVQRYFWKMLGTFV